MRTWKVLLVAALALPPLAYVAGAVAGPSTDPGERTPIVITPSTQTPAPGASPTGSPSSPAPSASPGSSLEDCEQENESDDDRAVIPCPEGDDDQGPRDRDDRRGGREDDHEDDDDGSDRDSDEDDD